MQEMMLKLCRQIHAYTKKQVIQKTESCLQASKMIEIDVIGNTIKQMNSTYREEVLIKIIKDGRAMSVLNSSFDFMTISKAIDECIVALDFVEPDKYEDISAGPIMRSFFDGEKVVTPITILELAKKYIDETSSQYPNVLISRLRLPMVETSVLYSNSNNVELFHTLIKFDCFVEYTSKADMQSSYYYDFSFSDVPVHLLDLYEQRFWYELRNNTYEIQNITPICGCKILLAPSVVEDILIDGIYSLCNSIAVMSGTSLWINAINSCVADKRISVSLDPYHKSIVCGERITDDGTISCPFYLIQNGILKNYCLSRKASLVTGYPVALNTSDSVIVTGGNRTLDEMIAQVSNGIIISRYSGDDISPTGDFSGLAKNCYLIENGEIVSLLNDIRINGNVTEMLKGIGDISVDHNKNGYNLIPWMSINAGLFIEKNAT